jgi:lipid-A-disaccharide synthase-like uncharacterized protein
MNIFLIYALGMLAQTLFFCRTFIQWFKSETEGAVISPVIYWKISLLASLLMMLYGIFRHDPVILLGQAIVYYVYVRNLQIKKAWKAIHPFIRFIFVGIPAAFLIFTVSGQWNQTGLLQGNREIPVWLMIWGISGQLLFSFRFVLQWIHSEIKGESLLPMKFWIVSALGALIILVYAVFRLDPVLFLSNSLGIFVYIRNILLYKGRVGMLSGMHTGRLIRIVMLISQKIR